MEKKGKGSENNSKNSLRNITDRWNEDNFISEEDIEKNRQMERYLGRAAETAEWVNSFQIKPFLDKEFLSQYGPGALMRFGDLVKEILIYFNQDQGADNWEKGVQELLEREKC